MTDFLPEELQRELSAAQRRAEVRKSRLRVEAGGVHYRVLRLRKSGFSVNIEDAPNLRGLVDLYDGSRHLSQCLIVAAEAEGDLMHYEFKRNTASGDGAPLDYERDEDAPIALLPR